MQGDPLEYTCNKILPNGIYNLTQMKNTLFFCPLAKAQTLTIMAYIT